MKVTALTPRGYCHGVVSALRIIKNIAADDTIRRPVYVLGMVVHNEKITADFEVLGIHTLSDMDKTRLELLDEIAEGTVVFTAHGVSDDVIAKAEAKELNIIDTTCSDVTTSQETVKDYLAKGYSILFVGKKHHPESETVLSYSDKVFVIESFEDVEALSLSSDKIALTNQTTMSLFDIYKLFEAVKLKYPQVEIIEEQCDATKTRQLAVMNQPDDVDHCFVVGDNRSNNSHKLVEVALNRGTGASLIQSVEDLRIDLLKQYTHITVTSGASTPSQLTKEVIEFLTHFDKDDPKTHANVSKVKRKNLFTSA